MAGSSKSPSKKMSKTSATAPGYFSPPSGYTIQPYSGGKSSSKTGGKSGSKSVAKTRPTNYQVSSSIPDAASYWRDETRPASALTGNSK